VSYELYDPASHGVWEIYVDDEGNARVREVSVGMVERELAAARGAAEARNAFDPSDIEDARQRIFGAIVRRQGQPRFRQELLKAYRGQCAMTGCAVEQVLEAAHIHPYRGGETNVVCNGLLLRADIHTLFDLGLVRVDHDTLEVVISSLLQGTEYADLASRRLALPVEPSDHPSREALRWHSLQFVE
jgi:predicted restriction endonuclease